MLQFQGKRVWISGAGQGIGFGLAEAFASRNAIVGLQDLDASLALEATEKIKQRTSNSAIYPYVCDVSDTPTLKRMMEDFVQHQNGLDVVIANAGITNYGAFLAYSPEQFERLTSVNLRGTYFTCQFAAKAMINYGIPGRILLMSSVTGVQAHKNLSAYGMTKAGIVMMGKTLAVELGEYRITVNTLVPGATLTERTASYPDYEEKWKRVTPANRVAKVDDIVAASLYLASEEARHVTGTTMVIDGGWTISGNVPPEDKE